MVAYVEGSSRADITLDYNERKLAPGKAVFIAAYNYWENKEQLQRDQKLERLQERALRRSGRVRKHTAHMSLNFHPNDKLTDRQYALIAAQYLKAIDFADQPALVYKHLDAGHPHLHIVSSNIRPDGTRIPNDLRSPKHLEQVCHQLEKIYHLTPASERGPDGRRLRQHQPTYIQRLQYGQSATRTGIENVLTNLLEKYIYCSLDNLNAVLGRYNVMADRGSPSSHLYRNRGLYYRALDDEGRKIGAPIKASAFDLRPTLDYLEHRFLENRQKLQKREYDQHIAARIDWTILQLPSSANLGKFMRRMEQQRMQVVIDRPRKNQVPQPDGHGFYYIDCEQKVVFRDTELGENYSALSIFQRLHLGETLEKLVQQKQLHLPNLREYARLLATDPREKLPLWMQLASQHDQLVNTAEKESSLRLRDQQREQDYGLEL